MLWFIDKLMYNNFILFIITIIFYNLGGFTLGKQIKADIGLLFITIGWGASFILTKNAIDHMPTYNFLAIRFILAFLISSAIFIKQMIKIDKETLKYGVILGVLLYSLYAFQTVGLCYTTASKSAFISGFNVVLVPLFASLLTRNAPDKKTYISIVLAFVGIAMMTLNQSISEINKGDFYSFISSIVTSLYIIYVGKFTIKVNSVPFAIIQIGVVGLLSLITSFIIESPIVPTNSFVWTNIVILSVVCTSGAFIIQSVAQKYTTATHTALIYTAEPVFAGIFSYILLGELLTPKAILGAVLILVGMIISELDIKILFNKQSIEDGL